MVMSTGNALAKVAKRETLNSNKPDITQKTSAIDKRHKRNNKATYPILRKLHPYYCRKSQKILSP